MSGPATTLRSNGRRSEAPASAEPGIAAGTAIGRYVILGVAGSGGFGTVYIAYDPELDRSVALKRFREPIAGHHGVLSEARALAKLRHPNIVAIYDVGEHQGHAFVAMEYVPGPDLGAWLAQETREWAAIARLMADAARGLAAAHDAGIVHRDFKPQNVLVGHNDVGYVADFGLAVARDSLASGSGSGERPTHDSGDRRPVGTPEYLAPELYDGAEAGPRSDVFSFCVTLWEAAFGERPWVDQTEAALVTAKRGGPPLFPREGVVPRRLAKVLRAGLDPDPNRRPAAMNEITAALAEPTGHARRWIIAGGLVAAGFGVWALTTNETPCRNAAVAVDAVWNNTVRGELEGTVLPSPVAHAEEAWRRTSDNIDRWAERWRSQRTDACEATHVRHEQSEALLDARGRCFDAELASLRALLDLLENADPEVFAQAPQATAKLAAQLDCSAAATEDNATPADGPALQPLLADLDRIGVLENLALYDQGLTLARSVEARAAELGAVEIGLRARHRRGRLLDLTGDAEGSVALHTAVHWEAEANDFDGLAATAAIDAMYEYAAPLGKPEVALTWEPHANAALRRAGDDPRRRAKLIDNRGIALLYTHDPEAAAKAHETALALRETYDTDGLDTVATLQNLGIVYEELHRYDEAIALHQRAYEILRRLVGEHHPHTARIRDNLGTAQLRAGNIDAAIENFEFALDVRRSVLGPQHRSVALSIMHLGLAELEQEAWPNSIARFEEALAILSAGPQPEARNVWLCHEGLAHSYQGAGRTDEAKKHAQLAFDGLKASLPADHPELVGLRSILDAELDAGLDAGLDASLHDGPE